MPMCTYSLNTYMKIKNLSHNGWISWGCENLNLDLQNQSKCCAAAEPGIPRAVQRWEVEAGGSGEACYSDSLTYTEENRKPCISQGRRRPMSNVVL